MPKLEDVFDLYTKMLLGMGAVFQMPTVVFFLSKVGLVSARFLWRSFRYAVLMIFVGRRHHADGRHGDAIDFRGADGRPVLLSIVIAWVFGRKRPEPAADTDD